MKPWLGSGILLTAVLFGCSPEAVRNEPETNGSEAAAENASPIDSPEANALGDATTGPAILTLEGHTDAVNGVAYSLHGQTIVSASRDRTLRLWNAETGDELQTLSVPYSNGYTNAVFRHDGKCIVAACSYIRIWDLETNETLDFGPDEPSESINCVAYSPDGKKVVSGSGDSSRPGKIQIWDAETGQELQFLGEHSIWVKSVAFSPDGTRVASGSQDGSLKIWSTETGEELIRLLADSGSIASAAFRPDGRRIVAGGGNAFSAGKITIWGTRTGLKLLSLKGHGDWVTSVAYSPDGKHIVSGSADKTVRIWDAETGEELLALHGHTSGVVSVAFSPDGKHVASGSYDKTVKIWELSIQ